jgi:DNA repair exonuclease SbcCD ATPase subunit
VLWSQHSIKSSNVRHEATIAQKARKLISVLLDPLEAEEFPMGLYSEQAVRLINWSGDDSDEGWQKIRKEIVDRLTPHVPPWLQRAIHSFEADVKAERTVRRAESRAREMEKKLASGAEAALDVERDRDRALDEVADLKARLGESGKAQRELEARITDLQRSLQEAESECQALSQKLGETSSARATATLPRSKLKPSTTKMGRVLDHDQTAGPLGKNALRSLRLETGIRAGVLGEEMLLVAQAFAGGAIEDPVLLPFVQNLKSLQQHDRP